MPLFAGPFNPQLRLRVALSAMALGALVLSLLLAFASVSISLPSPRAHAPESFVFVQPRAKPAAASSGIAERNQSTLLWAMLTPWALAVDAAAVLGLLAMTLSRRR
jgi:hypothetical protein